MKSKLLILLVASLAFCGSVMAGAIAVPNGGFDILYKPGTGITGTIAQNGWTYGVGPGTTIESQTFEFDDGTTGDIADIPGWVGYDEAGWLEYGPSYGRDEKGLPAPVVNLQGAVGNQGGNGNLFYLSNGGGWGNPAGGLIVSDAPIGTVTGEALTLSMIVQNNGGAAQPIVLDLLANGVALTPDSTVDAIPTGGVWTEISRTYDAATMAGVIGQDLTIVLGVGRGATGAQTRFDDVTLVPEPATMALLGMGGLALIRRRRS